MPPFVLSCLNPRAQTRMHSFYASLWCIYIYIYTQTYMQDKSLSDKTVGNNHTQYPAYIRKHRAASKCAKTVLIMSLILNKTPWAYIILSPQIQTNCQYRKSQNTNPVQHRKTTMLCLKKSSLGSWGGHIMILSQLWVICLYSFSTW